MRAGYGEKTRALFARMCALKLIDFGGFQVFESATVDTSILLIRNGTKQNILEAAHFKSDYKKQQTISEYFKLYKIKLSNVGSDIWYIGNSTELALKLKIESIGTPLKSWDLKVSYGVKTGCNDAFIIDSATKLRLIAEDPNSSEIIKPVLRGRDIKRYSYMFADLYLIATFPALHLDINRYPSIKRYLEMFGKERLEQSGKTLPDGTKSRKKTYNQWFETQDQVSYFSDFEKEKVMWQEMSSSPAFVLDTSGYFCIDTARIMIGKHVASLVGIFNSKLFHFAFSRWYAGGGLGGSGVRYKGDFMKSFPIPQVNNSNMSIFREIESYIRKMKPSDIDEYSNTIDQLVYDLYQLTPVEIELIEETV